MAQVPHKRAQDYVNRAVYLQKFAKELRLTNIFSVLFKNYERGMEGNINEANRFWKKHFIYMTLRNTFAFPLMYEGIWLVGSYLMMVRKSITLADFIVINSAVNTVTWMVIGFTGNLTDSLKNALYVDNLKTFLEYKEKIPENQPGLPVPEFPKKLELREVSFSYPGSKKNVLSNISITLERDKIVSLVGHNGSGKTTLVKLLMRLYDPDEGVILLDGTDIRKFELAAYRRVIASTFQDFQLFSMSVYDNVLLGNKPKGEPEQSVREALEQSGILEKIETLPHRDKTIMTREFDDEGISLSIGESQKLAISRAFAKKSNILILDEPSSALDPVAEYKMYNNFTRLCEGKISVFISHRMSTAAMADNIYLLENGHISEQGDHRSLMILNGSYADMFRTQAENYLLDWKEKEV